MARYIDGFVIPVPKGNIEVYRRMAQKAGKLWLELGALEFHECVGDDLKVKRESDEGLAHHGHDGGEDTAVRREADGVWGFKVLVDLQARSSRMSGQP